MNQNENQTQPVVLPMRKMIRKLVEGSIAGSVSRIDHEKFYDELLVLANDLEKDEIELLGESFYDGLEYAKEKLCQQSALIHTANYVSGKFSAEYKIEE